MKHTKLFLVEEHHEAYYVWKHAVAHQLIAPSKNILLHLDEHSDMAVPNMNTSLHELNGNLTDIKQFTYAELNIASFIIPAIYQGIINKVYWIKQRHGKSNRQGHKLYVRSDNNDGNRLITGRLSVLHSFEEESRKLKDQIIEYRFYKQHIEEIGKIKNVLLDIDLDYFSCIQDPLKNTLLVAITKEEYEQFLENPYHRMRFFDFGRVDVKNVNGKYFYCLNNYSHPYVSPVKVPESRILERINKVISKLKEKEISPDLITICRSRFSGYTPPDQWEFIEEHLTKGLESIYDISGTHHISEI